MSDKVDLVKRRETLCWWVRVLTNIYAKLYANHYVDFCRDHRCLTEHLIRFRNRCKGPNARWDIPDSEQERLIGKLVLRCQESLLKDAWERTYIPGYFGKALYRFVDEIADIASAKWKRQMDVKNIPPEMLKAAIEAAIARTIVERVNAL